MDDAPEGHAARGWPRHIAPLIAALLLALFVTDSWAAPRTVLDLDEAFAFSRARVGGTPGDFVLRDRDGQEVSLSRYRGKPLIVNFVFTGCFQVCPTSTRDLQTAVRAMRDRFGPNQFNVLSIGFNQPQDSPLAMKIFAGQLRIKEPNWDFLSPRQEDVAALTDAFGFRFRPSPAGFDHTVQVSLLDAQGVIRSQIYGDFSAEVLGEPIRRLLRGMLLDETHNALDFVERVRIFCSVYDPTTGKYKADYTLILQVAGGITFFIAMLWFGINEWWSQRQARRRVQGRVT
ncbi:MAG: SCO family protein [Rhodanobacteraceae bacterium]|nr:SCO family protein [Rhodanobacteraceae bacterium]